MALYPELVNGPFEVYLAVTGTAFPVVNAAPAAAWVKIGTGGSLNIEEGGIEVSYDQSVNKFRPLGGTGPRKAFRESEDVKIAFTLADFSAEAYAQTMGVAATIVGGNPGTRTSPMGRGSVIPESAMLIRGEGKSPYDPNGVANVQGELPRVSQLGAPSMKIVKGAPIMWALEFHVLAHDTLGMGLWKFQQASS